MFASGPTRTRATSVVVGLLVALGGTCSDADAAVARISGPSRPPAGETATYVLRAAPGMWYRVVVLAGSRPCPGVLLVGNPAQTFDASGFLNGAGAGAQQLSFSSGRSTLCAYDIRSETLVAANAIRTRPGRDRLRLTATKRDSDSNVYVSATGAVGRAGSSPFPDAADQYSGTVTVLARSRSARCPKHPPDRYSPAVAWGDISGAHFALDLTIFDALKIARDLRLCGWLTAPRRVAGIVQTRTVARAQKRLAATASDTPSSSDNSDAESLRGAMQRLLVVGLLAAGFIATIWITERRDKRRSADKPPPDPSGETSHDAAVADSTDPSPDYEFVQRRRGEEAAFAIQRAVGTTADVYRDRLRLILEHQDGPDWLAAFNARRRADMLARGQGPPATYASLEPRAVLNCLAYDPAGLQLIGLDAVAAARQLCGLANAAHHPDPDKPLTDADYQRAWRLYSQITGYAPPFDTYRGE